MKRGYLFTALVASVTSVAVAALVLLALLPAAIHAQAARTTATGLTVVNSDGLAGLTADTRPTGGGNIQILGTDGKTVRVGLGAGGGPAGQPINPATAGLSIYDVSGNAQIVRVGVISDTPSLAGVPAGVQLVDSQGHPRFRASLDGDGNPSLQFFDAAGNIIWSAP